MTALGKFLVFFNLACGLAFGGIALGLYTNRINWPGTSQAGASPEAAQGELGKRKQETDQLKENVLRVRTRWKDALYGNPKIVSTDALDAKIQGLIKLEELRPQRQAYYQEQLTIRRTGKNVEMKDVDNPVKDLDYKEGKLQVDEKNGYPILKDLEFLSLADLHAQIKLTQEKIDETIEGIKKDIKTQEKLSGEIKVIRKLQGEEEQVRQNAVAQLKFLEPFLYNFELESQVLLKRQRSLESRVQELKGAGVASR